MPGMKPTLGCSSNSELSSCFFSSSIISSRLIRKLLIIILLPTELLLLLLAMPIQTCPRHHDNFNTNLNKAGVRVRHKTQDEKTGHIISRVRKYRGTSDEGFSLPDCLHVRRGVFWNAAYSTQM
ncbi:uncharacterized protein LOC121405413 isoform X3 [Drosophila obscura]|uniref:uncharacterized protein LOC121405413 isoform X1 n=1 Tax=Drosophila obscura TaxID=7282 RepID=UPI001BB270FD|nr:uncharacterized protein LOC121405413 isoform X1 [Drosophila obscura]XP_041452020.1 uncharacterized protein LOC121405413 isoform X3 [Drosophila obscura]